MLHTKLQKFEFSGIKTQCQNWVIHTYLFYKVAVTKIIHTVINTQTELLVHHFPENNKIIIKFDFFGLVKKRLSFCFSSVSKQIIDKYISTDLIQFCPKMNLHHYHRNHFLPNFSLCASCSLVMNIRKEWMQHFPLLQSGSCRRNMIL